MRVHELAKELGVTSKDLLLKLKERNIEAKNHMANLDEDVVKLFLEERAHTKAGHPVTAVKKAEGTKSALKEKKFEIKREKAHVTKKEGTEAVAAVISKKEEETTSAQAETTVVKVLKPLEIEHG